MLVSLLAMYTVGPSWSEHLDFVPALSKKVKFWSNTLTEHTPRVKNSNRAVSCTVQIIEGSDNQGSTVPIKKSLKLHDMMCLCCDTISYHLYYCFTSFV